AFLLVPEVRPQRTHGRLHLDGLMDTLPVLASILVACVGGSLRSLALAAAVALRVRAAWIPTLVSFAVGALLGAVFLDILPEVFERTTHPSRITACLLGGILAF